MSRIINLSACRLLHLDPVCLDPVYLDPNYFLSVILVDLLSPVILFISLFLLVRLYLSGSRHAQLSIYAVFHEESDFEVKNKEIRRLDVTNEEKRGE